MGLWDVISLFDGQMLKNCFKTAQRWFSADEFIKTTLYWAFYTLIVRRMNYR